MKAKIDLLVLIIREMIRAHRERGDEERVQQYIPRLTNLVIQIESGEFQKQPKEKQISDLRALRGEYLGSGEVFGLLCPKYIEIEYEAALLQSIKEQIELISAQ